MTTFTLNGTIYSTNESGTYFYKTGENGKRWRIARVEWEQAWDEYEANTNDQAEADEQWDAENEIEERREEQEKKDKATEDAANGKTKKTAKKKAVVGGFEISAEGIYVVLTPKQADFILEMTKTSVWCDSMEGVGVNIDVLVEEVGGQFENKPMTIGAMVSTLREKHLLDVENAKVEGKKTKFMVFSPTGLKAVDNVIKAG